MPSWCRLRLWHWRHLASRPLRPWYAEGLNDCCSHCPLSLLYTCFMLLQAITAHRARSMRHSTPAPLGGLDTTTTLSRLQIVPHVQPACIALVGKLPPTGRVHQVRLTALASYWHLLSSCRLTCLLIVALCFAFMQATTVHLAHRHRQHLRVWLARTLHAQTSRATINALPAPLVSTASRGQVHRRPVRLVLTPT